ncbi:hypothetical protein HDV00_004521 [Rhizophlyctis rosea]|nr:hypothetical protein HDV00_004521 [Rhizophlyctis rosea]
MAGRSNRNDDTEAWKLDVFGDFLKTDPRLDDRRESSQSFLSGTSHSHTAYETDYSATSSPSPNPPEPFIRDPVRPTPAPTASRTRALPQPPAPRRASPPTATMNPFRGRPSNRDVDMNVLPPTPTTPHSAQPLPVTHTTSIELTDRLPASLLAPDNLAPTHPTIKRRTIPRSNANLNPDEDYNATLTRAASMNRRSRADTEGANIAREARRQQHFKTIGKLNWIVRGVIFFALALLAAYVWYFGWYKEAIKYKFCQVLNEDFNGDSINRDIWSFERQVGGFGTGEFDWTTDDAANAYVKNGKLYIMPTFTSDTFGDDAVMGGATLNLTANGGTCTSTKLSDCVISSNSTNSTMGILPPIQSARLTTKNSVSIKYGKVEVRARMPRGDWLWPAIWMFPKDQIYGPWPASGEIDIAEARGNDRSYSYGGRDKIGSTLHWGPLEGDPPLNQFWRTTNEYQLRRGTYDQDWHTFGMIWTPERIFMYVDTPLRQSLSIPLGDFWTWGNFPETYWNGTAVKNPWYISEGPAPFDQEFYLILNVAVGGTNEYFPDGIGSKPWTNKSPRGQAMKDFWDQRGRWLKSWPSDEGRALAIESVKMWKLC